MAIKYSTYMLHAGCLVETLNMNSQNNWSTGIFAQKLNVAVHSHNCVCFLLDLHVRVYLMLDVFWIGAQHEFTKSLN